MSNNNFNNSSNVVWYAKPQKNVNFLDDDGVTILTREKFIDIITTIKSEILHSGIEYFDMYNKIIGKHHNINNIFSMAQNIIVEYLDDEIIGFAIISFRQPSIDIELMGSSVGDVNSGDNIIGKIQKYMYEHDEFKIINEPLKKIKKPKKTRKRKKTKRFTNLNTIPEVSNNNNSSTVKYRALLG